MGNGRRAALLLHLLLIRIGHERTQQDPNDRETPRQARAPDLRAFKPPAHTNGALSRAEIIGGQQYEVASKREKGAPPDKKKVASLNCPKTINNSSSCSAAPHVRISSTTKGTQVGERMKDD
jgi:hypothetical protein